MSSALGHRATGTRPAAAGGAQSRRSAGYDSLTADTTIDALTYLKSGRIPDLALIDIRLPDLRGTKLARRILEQHPRIPVLFVSGWVGETVDPDQLADLRWEFLQKPYISHALAGHRAAAQRGSSHDDGVTTE